MAKISQLYRTQQLKGWAGIDLAREAFQLIGPTLPKFEIKNKTRATIDRMMIFEVEEKVLNMLCNSKTQLIGDCVSWGMKHGIEGLQCTEILMKGDAEKWFEIFSPYHYGTGRLIVGGGRISGPDGSLGIWQAESSKLHGFIRTIDEGVPEYSGNIAAAWGTRREYIDKYLTLGKTNLLKTYAKINNVDELIEALANGYPATVASNVGFNMKQNSAGYHTRAGNWAHQMCFMGFKKGAGECIALKNSWGDAHGEVIDFDTKKAWPRGYLRISFKDADYMIKSGEETFALSGNFDGFPEQLLDKKLFDLIG